MFFLNTANDFFRFFCPGTRAVYPVTKILPCGQVSRLSIVARHYLPILYNMNA